MAGEAKNWCQQSGHILATGNPLRFSEADAATIARTPFINNEIAPLLDHTLVKQRLKIFRLLYQQIGDAVHMTDQ